LYSAKQAELGGTRSAAWQEYSETLRQRYHALIASEQKSFASAPAVQAKILVNLKKELDQGASSALECGIHVLYLMVGNHFNSVVVHAENAISTPSAEMKAFWESLSVQTADIYQYLLRRHNPKLADQSELKMEEQQKVSQSQRAQDLYSSFSRRLKFLLNHYGISSFPNPSLSLARLQWVTLPTLLVTHKSRFINCAPIHVAPPAGAFKCEGSMSHQHCG
jgi:hypothetical protein